MPKRLTCRRCCSPLATQHAHASIASQQLRHESDFARSVSLCLWQSSTRTATCASASQSTAPQAPQSTSTSPRPRVRAHSRRRLHQE
eukprot:5466096-Pleurochrysis_carterae.AAC.1